MPKADERLALSLVNQLSCPSNYIPALIPSFAPSFCMGMYRTTEAVRGRDMRVGSTDPERPRVRTRPAPVGVLASE